MERYYQIHLEVKEMTMDTKQSRNVGRTLQLSLKVQLGPFSDLVRHVQDDILVAVNNLFELRVPSHGRLPPSLTYSMDWS